MYVDVVIRLTVSMNQKEEKSADQTLDTSSSHDGEEPTGVDQLQISHGSQLQQLTESEMSDQRKWMEDRLERHSCDVKTMIKNEFGRLMEEEKKSLTSGHRLQVELNQMKHSLESDNSNQLERLRENLEQQLDIKASRTSESCQQQLEAARHDLSRQLNELRRSLETTQMFVVGLLVVLVATILFAVDMKSWTDFQDEPARGEDELEVGFDKQVASKHFMDGVDELRSTFPNQTGRLWRIIEAATLPIIEEDNPAHPAVILLVAAKGSESVAECLAQRYALLVTESLNAAAHTTISCETYADSDPDDAKGQLDSRLSSAFGGGSKSAVVLRLEKLPGPAAMIFYRFADNDNAPYKDVAIVLTLTLESTDTGSEKDHVAYDELRKVWGSSLDVDKVEPLLSRIGNSVAFVRLETTDTLSQNGC